MRTAWLVAWYGGLLSAGVSAAASWSPKVSSNDMAHMPKVLRYFAGSSTVLYLDEQEGRVYMSKDDGAKWEKVAEKEVLPAIDIYMHPYDDTRAYIMSAEKSHLSTRDRGETWHKFESAGTPSHRQDMLTFHAGRPDEIILAIQECRGSSIWGARCRDNSYITKDNFRDKLEPLLESTATCAFGQGSKLLKDKVKDDNLIFCVEEDPDSKLRFPLNLRLSQSSDYFKTSKPVEVDGNEVRAVVGLGAIQSFIIVAARHKGTDELSLFVTDDGVVWDKGEFPTGHGKLEEDAYTILESRPYSIQVDVLSTRDSPSTLGSLYTSNSNGTYFTRKLEHTNRNQLGIVDFENIQGVEGVALANVVKNHEQVSKDHSVPRKVETKITFDDGASWQLLDSDEKEPLHLHSASHPHNIGRIFSSNVPGILLAIGNTGSELNSYHDGHLYMSDTAGAAWKQVLKGSHKYEWGDQGGVLVAVGDNRDGADKVSYSFDRGANWQELELPDTIHPRILTTVTDSSTAKFLLIGTPIKKDEKTGARTYTLDFSGYADRKCGKDDFEQFYARYDDKKQPTCLMGHKQFFQRKKADSKCYVGEAFEAPKEEEENCPCTDEDYECDYNFVRAEDGTCKPASESAIVPKGACGSDDKTFKGSSGYRLIPGNTCDRKKGVDKEETIERDCPGGGQPGGGGKNGDKPKPGEVATTTHSFDSSVRQYFYLERTKDSSGDDQTIVAQLNNGQIHITSNFGRTWTRVLPDEELVAVVSHEYFKDWIYLFTAGKKAFASKDRGQSFTEIKLPAPPNMMRIPLLDFHSTRSNWLIFTGQEGCESTTKRDCRPIAYYTENGGRSWHELLDYVQQCSYIGTTDVDANDNLIYCTTNLDKDDKPGSAMQLRSSIDYFSTSQTHFTNVLGYAVFEEFVVVAEIHEDDTLRMQVSVDGETFAEGHFPPRFRVELQQAYTVLDSVTKAIFLHVTTQDQPDREYGSLLKSNSNGTYFVTSLDAVNRDPDGYVDFEKMRGLEGVAIVNVVRNRAEVDEGASKALRTMMTHNDGGDWSYLAAPAKDSAGRSYDCRGSDCNLNLHGYTERVDVRDTYSSGSAIGILFGVGNVGPTLSAYKDGDTFMSTDGGIKWTEVRKGTYQWEFGDSGSIIVIVDDGKATDKLFYTLDAGDSWKEYKFSEKDVVVKDISTVPSDTSTQFLLFGETEKESLTFSVDFSSLRQRECVLKEGSSDDYYLWTPSHPSNEAECLFGHVSQYHRKKPNAECWVGTEEKPSLHSVLRNCTCTIYDFECDYNYQRANDGTCQLIPGLDPPDHSAICAKDENAVFYTEPTGYRRVPLTTCEGGKHFDQGINHPCPGKEKDFEKVRKKGASGFGLFLLIVLPFGFAGLAGLYAYRQLAHRRLGQIRLGDESFDSPLGGVGGGAGGFGQENPVLRFGVDAVSAVVAVTLAVPIVALSLWQAARRQFDRTTRYSSRSAFATNDYDRLGRSSLADDDFDDV